MASNGRCISISSPLGCLRIQRILSKGRNFHSELAPGVDHRSDLDSHKAATAVAGLSFRTCLFPRRLEPRPLIQPNPGLKCPTLAELPQGLNKKGATRKLSSRERKRSEPHWPLKKEKAILRSGQLFHWLALYPGKRPWIFCLASLS